MASYKSKYSGDDVDLLLSSIPLLRSDLEETEQKINVFYDEKGALKEFEEELIPDSIARKTDILQPDYNQNDEKQTDYIKNRPFYEVFVSEDWLKDRAFKYPPEGSDDVAWFYYREDMNSVYGHGWALPFTARLDITIDGVTETHDVTITNTYDSVDITSHEYPVSISPIADIGDGLLTGFALVCLANGVSGTATLSWLEMKQIDEKFIPNTIARIEDVDKNFIEICAPERSQNLPFKQIESSDDVVRFVLRDDIDGSVIETEKYRPLSYGLTGYFDITINGITERKKVEFSSEDLISIVSQGYLFNVGVSCFYGAEEPLIIDVNLICTDNITGTASFSYEKEKVFKELHIPDTIARTKDVDNDIEKLKKELEETIANLKQGLKLESPNGSTYFLKVADDGVLTTELCLPDGAFINENNVTVYDPGTYEIFAVRKLGTDDKFMTTIPDTTQGFEEYIMTGSPAIGSMTIESLPYQFTMPNASESERVLSGGSLHYGVSWDDYYETELCVRKVEVN